MPTSEEKRRVAESAGVDYRAANEAVDYLMDVNLFA